MIELDVFISGGDEIADLRDLADNTIRRLDQMFRVDMEAVLVLRVTWDFRIDPPAVVPRGQMAAKSLTMVERSAAVVVILGEHVPPITRQEVLRAFELRASGVDLEVWVFLQQGARGREHDQLLEEIGQVATEDVVYAQFHDRLDFQGLLFTTLVPYVMRRVESSDGPIFGRV